MLELRLGMIFMCLYFLMHAMHAFIISSYFLCVLPFYLLLGEVGGSSEVGNASEECERICDQKERRLVRARLAHRFACFASFQSKVEVVKNAVNFRRICRPSFSRTNFNVSLASVEGTS